MIITLLIILLALFILIGKKRGLKSFFSLTLNYLVIITTLIVIYLGLDPIITTLISCILISVITVFYLNGNNIKTKSSFISIIIILTILFIGMMYFNNKLSTEGFSYESIEEVAAFSYNVNLDMNKVSMSVLLLAIMGAISDTSMAISSAIFEINTHNPKMTKKELLTSGMNVGKDILGTTINTLFFAFMSVFIGFFVWHYNESIIKIINYKEFANETLQVLFSCIGCILIIPVTSLITIYKLKKN